LIDLLHEHRRWAQGVIFNPGAYAHYSYALRDAVAAIGVATIEFHLTDVKRREPFRRRSVIAPACVAAISGKGVGSYLEAVDRLVRSRLQKGRRRARRGTPRSRGRAAARP